MTGWIDQLILVIIEQLIFIGKGDPEASLFTNTE